MMKQDIILSDDSHSQIKQLLKDVRVSALGEVGQVRLLLATQSHRAINIGPERPQGATTLAVDMDRQTAMRLLLQLHDLSNKMGWPLQEAISGPSGFQTSVLQGPRHTPKEEND